MAKRVGYTRYRGKRIQRTKKGGNLFTSLPESLKRSLRRMPPGIIQKIGRKSTRPKLSGPMTQDWKPWSQKWRQKRRMHGLPVPDMPVMVPAKSRRRRARGGNKKVPPGPWKAFKEVNKRILKKVKYKVTLSSLRSF